MMTDKPNSASDREKITEKCPKVETGFRQSNSESSKDEHAESFQDARPVIRISGGDYIFAVLGSAAVGFIIGLVFALAVLMR